MSYTFGKFFGFSDTSTGIRVSLGDVASVANNFYQEWMYVGPVTKISYDKGLPEEIVVGKDTYKKAS